LELSTPYKMKKNQIKLMYVDTYTLYDLFLILNRKEYIKKSNKIDYLDTFTLYDLFLILNRKDYIIVYLKKV